MVDLTRPPTDAAERGSLVYYAEDIHWSPEGHRIAAGAIAAVWMRREPRAQEGAPADESRADGMRLSR
jgi:hypothetical protein